MHERCIWWAEAAHRRFDAVARQARDGTAGNDRSLMEEELIRGDQRVRRAGVALMLGIAMLTGCSGQEPADQSANTEAARPEPVTTGVTRDEVAAAPAPVATAAPAAIQTQPGPKGAQVSLNKVAVTGDIMTVALSYSGGDCCAYTPVDKVSAIDDATSQRLGVLKDNAGNWMAAPLFSNNSEIRVDKSTDSPAQVWFKFPAPPATSKTVSITIPDVAPFDAVPVVR